MLVRQALKFDGKIGNNRRSMPYRKCVITVSGCTAPLPCGVVDVLAVVQGECSCDCGVLYDSTYNIMLPYWGEKYYPVLNLAYGLVGFNWTVQDNCLHFDRDIDGQKFTIGYLGYELDADGFPLISENHVVAIEAGLVWDKAKSTIWGVPALRQNGGTIKELERQWHFECSIARELDGAQTPIEKAKWIAGWNNPTIQAVGGDNIYNGY